eukprot:scaffold17384_cov110-Isochrysis_galbana.AAC.4
MSLADESFLPSVLYLDPGGFLFCETRGSAASATCRLFWACRVVYSERVCYSEPHGPPFLSHLVDEQLQHPVDYFGFAPRLGRRSRQHQRHDVDVAKNRPAGRVGRAARAVCARRALVFLAGPGEGERGRARRYRSAGSRKENGGGEGGRSGGGEAERQMRGG